ncbi:TetR/AcrR family transcriptional regulator [Pseudonocardia pini]|uniref:TetR/AcrR family transcriptional regulator n=1 Tax=Pseudonocardia pini TaxID=2758030 RepID=UPI0015EFF1BF|nr:TetR family transcriptional regulator [Pseudonocardia pini]
MVGLRERKKLETRRALSWAAIRLVVERGIAGVRVEDVAEEAGVSERTFRNYFATLADAVADRHLERSLQIADELRRRPAGEPLWEALRRAVETRFGLGAADSAPDPVWVAGVRAMVTEPGLHGAMQKTAATAAETLAAAVADRTGTDPERDLYPKLVAAAVGAAVGAATEHWLRADPPVPMGPLLVEALDRLSSGLPEPSEEDA